MTRNWKNTDFVICVCGLHSTPSATFWAMEPKARNVVLHKIQTCEGCEAFKRRGHGTARPAGKSHQIPDFAPTMLAQEQLSQDGWDPEQVRSQANFLLKAVDLNRGGVMATIITAGNLVGHEALRREAAGQPLAIDDMLSIIRELAVSAHENNREACLPALARSATQGEA